MIIEDAIAFLKKVPPFQFLGEEDLRAVASNLSMEFYPKGTVVLRQDGPPSEALRIIKKGGVKVSMTTEDGTEVVIDYRGEGDTFGFLSLVNRDRVRSNVTAVEDTICYLIGKDMLKKLMDMHLSFTEYFLKFHITRYIDRTYQEMQDRGLSYGGSDRLLFTTRVGDIAEKAVVTAHAEATIQNAARIMAENKISSLVIVDDNNLPVGIVTDRDLRERVVARGRDMNEAVGGIMSTSLIRVNAADYCFEAVLKMLRYNIHHVLVVREGRLSGVITNHDLMMLQGTSPLSITKDIDNQQTIEGVVAASRRINKIVKLLLKEGARAGNIMKTITEINDRLVRKIMEITEKRCGRPPLPFCWIAFGSEGRKEQTFKTDQDNAIIYADPRTTQEEAAAKEYFTRFAALANDALVQCGFPPCPGGYMANNLRWRQPISVWKRYFSDWIYAPTEEAVLLSVIVFDFRPVYGDFSLAEGLRLLLASKAAEHGVFLKSMANMAISIRPPLGFFGGFVVEKDGEHKNELNLKFRCLAPLVNIVRLFSLEAGVLATSTHERIEALKDKHKAASEHGDDILSAFEFLSFLRIHHQIEQIEAGREPDNFINPDTLTNLEKKALKEASHLISKIQDAIARQYNPGTVM